LDRAGDEVPWAGAGFAEDQHRTFPRPRRPRFFVDFLHRRRFAGHRIGGLAAFQLVAQLRDFAREVAAFQRGADLMHGVRRCESAS